MSSLAEQIFVSLLTTSGMAPEDDAKTALRCADIFYEAERSHTQKKHEETQKEKTREDHEQVIEIKHKEPQKEADKDRQEQVTEILNHGTPYGQTEEVKTVVSLLMRNGMRDSAAELLLRLSCSSSVI